MKFALGPFGLFRKCPKSMALPKKKIDRHRSQICNRTQNLFITFFFVSEHKDCPGLLHCMVTCDGNYILGALDSTGCQSCSCS